MTITAYTYDNRNDVMTYDDVHLINYDVREKYHHRYEVVAYFESRGIEYAVPSDRIVSIAE